MSYKLRLSATILVPCHGTVVNEEGQRVPFSYWLVCDRLRADQVKTTLESADNNMAAFMRKVTRGWQEILDDGGKPLAFTADGLDELLSGAGQARVAYDAFCDTCAAKAKN